MAISVELLQFLGFAVMPGDLSIGEAASIEGQVVTEGGGLLSASLKRFTAEATLKGLGEGDATNLISKARGGRLSILRGNSGGSDPFSIGGFELQEPVLVKAVPSSAVIVMGVVLMDVSATLEDTIYQ